MTDARTHAPAAGRQTLGAQLNWLRAGVLGANDGIVSIAGLMMGFAGASADRPHLLIAGVAGTVAGALSMGGGEYVSVSTQRDTEAAALAHEQRELDTDPEGELEQLAGFYADRGLSGELAHRVAEELTAHDPLAAHAEVQLGLDSMQRVNPWAAMWASMVSFALGAALPLLAMVFISGGTRVLATVVAVLCALTLTGVVSARLGRAPVLPAAIRNVGVGVASMGLTYAVGSWVGAVV